jgi:hypothetical protein
MSKMTDIRGFITRAFWADDKETLAQIVKDAEANGKKNGNGDDDHDEPDGDEGTHIHLHMEGKDGKRTGDEQDPDTESRLKNLEDGFKDVGRKMSKIMDALGVKDGELPEALKKHQFGAKDEGDDDDDDKKDNGDGDDNGDGEDDGDKKENPFAKKEDTDDAPTANEGAMTASDPGSVAGAELMEADPALKTGKSMMGDAKNVGRWNTALAHYIRDNVARAEVLSPGIKANKRTLDHGGVFKINDTGKAICDLRRDSLGRALTTDAGKQAVGRYVTKAALKAMSCDAVRMAFLTASDNMRALNNAAGTPQPGNWTHEDPRAFRDAQQSRLHSINEANRKFWAEQTGRPN